MTREKPPLRLHVEAETPAGRHYRWAADAPDARDKPSASRFSSTMPGGYETHDVTLPRSASGEDADLERLTTLRVVGAGGDIASETRLERAPRVSGDQMSVSPSAVGWQAHLSDDKSAVMIAIDRDLSQWQGPSRSRQIAVIASNANPTAAIVSADPTTGSPTIETGIDENGGWTAAALPTCEGLYDAGDGASLGRIKAAWTAGVNVNAGDANWIWGGGLAADDSLSALDNSGNLRAGGPGTLDVSGASRRFAWLQLRYSAADAAGGERNLHFGVYWSAVRVFGDHGLTIREAAAGEEGFFASDLIAYVVRRWAPLLNFTEGASGTLQPSDFVIPQFAYPNRADAGELIRQATRFGLQDWAVWDNKTFYWHNRGARGRNWRARSGPTSLEETGPQIDRLWESVIVQYRDVDGSTRTVGPPGSGAGTETLDLKDSDPENPANKLGIIRRDMLQAGTMTAAGAIEIGRRFLEAQKILDNSGRATITGHVLDDHGVLHPYWRIKAGDQIAFTDATDTGYRRIVRASHDEDTLTCSVDLDAPPDALNALLERLGVVLVPLGIS